MKKLSEGKAICPFCLGSGKRVKAFRHKVSVIKCKECKGLGIIKFSIDLSKTRMVIASLK